MPSTLINIRTMVRQDTRGVKYHPLIKRVPHDETPTYDPPSINNVV